MRRRVPAAARRHLMIRFLLRFVGLCLLATGFVFFVYDGTKSIANHDSSSTPRSSTCGRSSTRTASMPVQGWLKLKAAWAWDPYLQSFFDLPAWVVIGIVAVVLILLGRKKTPLIGYARD